MLCMNEKPRGRGVANNPDNRFEKLQFAQEEFEQEHFEEEAPSNKTNFFRDSSKSILSKNTSPDVGFDYSVNPYRGCEHGCVYCYARPSHEYLGFSAGLDFETKIMIKENAPELLRKKLMSKSWKPSVINLSGVTDCYQPIERKLKLTRKCLQVLAEFKNPFCIITKNQLVTRDLDILKEMATINATAVFISVTSLNPKLTEKMEPRTTRPAGRLKTIETLAKNGIEVGVMVAPVVPGLTDHEMPELLKAVAEAGAKRAGYVPLRLPYGLDDLFENWLEEHFPDRKNKVLNRIKEMRGGKLNSSDFGSRMRGEGVYADQLRSMFHLYCQKSGLNKKSLSLSCEHFVRPVSGQLDLI